MVVKNPSAVSSSRQQQPRAAATKVVVSSSKQQQQAAAGSRTSIQPTAASRGISTHQQAAAAACGRRQQSQQQPVAASRSSTSVRVLRNSRSFHHEHCAFWFYDVYVQVRHRCTGNSDRPSPPWFSLGRTRVTADGDDEPRHMPLSLLLTMPLIAVQRGAQKHTKSKVKPSEDPDSVFSFQIL